MFGFSTDTLIDFAFTAFETIAILLAVVIAAALLIWVERRLLGVWQDRYGPNRVGPFGILQVAADMIKIFFKEDWIPPFADKAVFVIAPAIIMFTTLMAFAVVPFTETIGVVDLNIGILNIGHIGHHIPVGPQDIEQTCDGIKQIWPSQKPKYSVT